MTGFHIDGGYAEYFTVPWDSTAVVPEGLTDEEAAPLMVRLVRNVALLTHRLQCAGLTVYNGLRRSAARSGDLVAISVRHRYSCTIFALIHRQGIGGLGHLGVQFAHHMGFRTVAISNGAQKEQYARKLGADYYIDMSKQDVGAELVRTSQTGIPHTVHSG